MHSVGSVPDKDAALFEAERRLATLAEAGKILGASQEYEAELRQVAHLLAPEFADWCVVDLVEEGGIRPVAVAHADAGQASHLASHLRGHPVYADRSHGAGLVVRTGHWEFLPDVSEEILAEATAGDEEFEALRNAGLCSFLCVPMMARGRVLGAVSLATTSPRRLTARDCEFLRDLAGRAALVVDNARLYAKAERERTELEDASAALRRSNQDLQQFAYVASHDLQEPLRAVASYTQLLKRRYGQQLDADGDEFMAYIVDGVRRMQNLIQDLLAFSRVMHDARQIRQVSLEGVYAGVVLGLHAAIQESGAVLTHMPLPVVSGDEYQLSQLLQNLLSNAVKYRSAEPPRVHVAVEQHEGHWQFSVSDNGIGIDPQHHDRVFGVFKRLHPRNQYPGTGIGLAICKRIVEGHGGRIWLESTPGKGTTFFFTLPS